MTTKAKQSIWKILLYIAIAVAGIIGGKTAQIAEKTAPIATEVVNQLDEQN